MATYGGLPTFVPGMLDCGIIDKGCNRCGEMRELHYVCEGYTAREGSLETSCLGQSGEDHRELCSECVTQLTLPIGVNFYCELCTIKAMNIDEYAKKTLKKILRNIQNGGKASKKLKKDVLMDIVPRILPVLPYIGYSQGLTLKHIPDRHIIQQFLKLL